MNHIHPAPSLVWDFPALQPYRNLPLLMVHGKDSDRTALAEPMRRLWVRREISVDYDAPRQALRFPWNGLLAEGISAVLVAVPPVYIRKYALELGPFCARWGLLLLDPAGHDLLALWRSELQLDRQDGNAGNAAALRRAIREHDVISFDFFDTLFCRRTLAPEDTFAWVAAHCGLDPAFPAARARTERALDCAPLAQIYDALARQFHWDGPTRDRALQTELDFERRCLMPRRTMLRMIRYAQQCGKRVYIVSDTALPASFLQALLQEGGLREPPEIWVSCERGQTKYGGLFSTFRRHVSEDGLRFLHIGDNRSVDGVCAEMAGLSHFLIASVETLARQAHADGLAAECDSWNDRLAVGSVLAELFNDPFALNGDHRCPVASVQRFGALVLGPVAAGYLGWIAASLREHPADRVLFPARDGYLFHKLYAELRRQAPALPPAVYLPTSRSACLLADLQTEADQREWLHSSPYRTPREILSRRFLLTPPEDCPEEAEETALLRQFGQAISARSDALRQGYRRLLRRLHVRPEDRSVFCDLLSMGTSQYHLERIAGQTMTGLYLHRGQPDRPEKERLTIRSYLEDPQLTAVTSYHFLLEFVFSAPAPSLHYVDTDGTPVYEPEKRSDEELRVMAGLQRGVARFARQYFALALPGQSLSPRVADALLHYGMSGAILVTDPALRGVRIYDDWSDVYLHCFT